jgi:SAM-dependent MidA family methyltransferase
MSTNPILPNDPLSSTPQGLSLALQAHIRGEIQNRGGWMGFDDFMSLALYARGLGYYANGSTKFGEFAQSGSDFVTAPEMTPLFGKALARQVAQALDLTRTDEVWEFGAGSGALAFQLLEALGDRVRRYTIADVSDSLKARQAERLDVFKDKVQWVSTLPQDVRGVVVGNEVLDAMPVKLLMRLQGEWHERGVVWQEGKASGGFAWSDRPTPLRPPVEIDGVHDYLTEIHLQGEAFVRTLAQALQQGAVFLLDYGFPEHEYYHVQRHMGTVMCHRAHQSDTDPLCDVGLKDVTAHVNFTGVALAAQDTGCEVLGYTSQAHFLINCGIAQDMQSADVQQRVAAQKLIMEHEMGEFFKVIAWTAGPAWDALGFTQGDRTHRL